MGLSVSVWILGAVCSYLGDGDRGHLDTLLKQHAQDAVLLLQVKHAGPQLHTLLLQVLRKHPEEETDGRLTVADGDVSQN